MPDDRNIPVPAELLDRLRQDMARFDHVRYSHRADPALYQTVAALLVQPVTEEPAEPVHSGSVAMVGGNGWSWLCHDCDVDKQLPYDTAEGAIAAFQRHAKRVMGSSGDTEETSR